MTSPSQNSAQPLIGYRTNEEWDDLLGQIATMIEDLERLEEPDIRGRVFSVLQAIDALHREALHRLVRLFKEGVLEQVATDPAIRTLLEMYDLLPAPHASSRKVWDFLTAKEKEVPHFPAGCVWSRQEVIHFQQRADCGIGGDLLEHPLLEEPDQPMQGLAMQCVDRLQSAEHAASNVGFLQTLEVLNHRCDLTQQVVPFFVGSIADERLC